MNTDKRITGFTAGNFDLIHPGYIVTFEEAKKTLQLFNRFFTAGPFRK